MKWRKAPHGSVAVTQPRPRSKDPDLTSASTLVLCMLGHKKDQIAKSIDENIAVDLNTFIGVIAGIRRDDIPPAGIRKIINEDKEILIEKVTKKRTHHTLWKRKESEREIMSKRIVIGIAGASGVIYGIRILSLLKETDYETHLILSEAAEINLRIETNYSIDDVKSMADFCYENSDVSASLASGSFLTQGMIVAPCTIKSLSGIANSYTTNLIVRAADVTLKEKRKLVLMIRETPLHKGHLRLMTMAADMGAHILPPVPSFYHRPKTIDDIINQTVGKIFDYLGIEHNLFTRWGNKHASVIT